MTPAELEAAIFEKTALAILAALDDPEGTSPGWVQAALRFMKDNDVTAAAVPGSTLAKIQARMADRLPFPKMTGTE